MNKPALVVSLFVLGAAFAAAGIYVGETDDAPGAALLGFLLMIGCVVLGVKTARRKAEATANGESADR